MAKKRSEKGSIKALILTTAMRLFQEQGIHGTSLNDIAAAASISKGTLYYYYPAKEELVNDAVRVTTDSMTDLFFAWVSSVDRRKDPEQTIAELIESILLQKDMCKMHVVICVEASRNEQVSQLLAQKYKEWSVILELGTLKIRPREAETICKRSLLFFTMLNGCMIDASSGMEINIKELAHVLLSA